MLKRWIPEDHDGTNASSDAPASTAASAEPDTFDDDTVACLREVKVDRPGGFAGLVTSFVEDAARSLAAMRTALLDHDTATARRGFTIQEQQPRSAHTSSPVPAGSPKTTSQKNRKTWNQK